MRNVTKKVLLLLWSRGSLALLALLLLPVSGSTRLRLDGPRDAQVARAVREELQIDEVLSPLSLEVAVENDVVTLRGRAPTLRVKNRATAVTELVRGVRAVVNLIEVTPVPMTDTALEETIRHALVQNGVPGADDLGIVAKDGLVILSGGVASLRDRLRIEDVVGGVVGVLEIANELRVEGRAGRSDEDLQRSIASLLQWDAEVDSHHIEVSVDDRVATLRGTVGSAAEKSRAIHLSGVPGIVSIDASDLSVEPREGADVLRPGDFADVSSRQVKRAIEAALFYDPEVRSFEIKVEIERGVATLKGHVPSLEAKVAAENDAASVVGVVEVRNELSVRRLARRSDRDVRADVELAFETDPQLATDGIVVSVVDGVVYLYGRVPTGLHRQRARELASKIRGTARVENQIQVVGESARTREEDERIRWAIERRLSHSRLIDPSTVTVRVADGMATLEGSVASLKARQSATREAFLAGAILVKNELEVGRRKGAGPR